MSVKVRGKDDACCGLFFLKYLLYIFNFIFWLSGIAILAVGVWTLLDKHNYVSLLTSNVYPATTYLLLGTGAIVIIVGFIGCCGAWRENRFCLMTYATLLLLIFLLEAVAGILAHMYEATIREELLRDLNKTMLTSFNVDLDKTQAIENMQKEFKCCGAGSFEDWRYCPYFKDKTRTQNKAPDSCCKTISDKCAVRDHPSNIYYRGCIRSFQNFIKEHLIILGAIGLGLCALQIFGIVFACCLAKRIKEWKQRQAAYNW